MKGNRDNHLSIRQLISCTIAVMLILSALLLVATYKAASDYTDLSRSNKAYAQWHKDADDLQDGSDYLTEQVRCFVVTGERSYLDNYFEEANVTRSRDHAVEHVKRLVGETKAYHSLVNALGESVDLMNREYYAMALAVSGFGYDLSEYPQEIQNVELIPEDLAKTPEQQRELARTMVFDSVYHNKKEIISGHILECLQDVNAEMEERQATAQKDMQQILTLQRVMIIAAIASLTIGFLMMISLVVKPMLRAVTYVHKDQSIPVVGAREFRFLAQEYNTMHQTSLDQRKELEFEATHDKLTGVYNRNGYDYICQNVDWNTSALVLFDLDRFKHINDSYGHKMGDRVLTRAAKVIQNAFRAQDYVCRIGGDEFAVIMVQVSTDAGKRIEEKIEAINEALGKSQDGIPGIHTSCGVGYGALIPDFDHLFRETDAALYRVKGSGGTGCEFCG